MAEGYLAWNILFLQERVRRLERRVERRLLRDAQNPFELPQQEFIAQFRLNQDLAMQIVNILRQDLQKQRLTGLSPEIQVLIAIGFFAHGSYQRPTGNQCELVVSQPTVSRCIRKVAHLINIHLLRQWIKFPMTAQEEAAVQNKFALAAQPFPGAIDCTYINILAPDVYEEAYVNHHGNHSLNIQAVSITIIVCKVSSIILSY